MERMIIGYDAKRAFCNGTGLGNYSRGVIAGAVESGEVEAVLYTPYAKSRYEHWAKDLPHTRVKMPQGLWECAPSLWRTLAKAQNVEEDGVQVYHGLSQELPLGLPQKVVKLVTVHDLISWRYPQYFSPFDRAIYRKKMRYACRVADVVVAISEQTKQDLIELTGVPEEKIKVVYQTCDEMFWKEENKSLNIEAAREKYHLPDQYVVCVGTIEERKNQMCAIRAMQRLPEEIGLVIVGRPRGKYGQEVMKEANNRMRIVTNADFADFPALYRGALASVYISRFEGFGIPVLESMCCDTPVVTSCVSSMPEAGGDAALYANPDDDAAVAEHLLQLATDKEFRQECITKGRIQKRRFTPERVAKDMVEVYRSFFDIDD